MTDPPSKGSPAGLLGQSAGPGKTTNGQKPCKDKHLSPLTLRVKIHYRASDPSNNRGTDIPQGLLRMSTSLDILLARPLLTFRKQELDAWG